MKILLSVVIILAVTINSASANPWGFQLPPEQQAAASRQAAAARRHELCGRRNTDCITNCSYIEMVNGSYNGNTHDCNERNRRISACMQECQIDKETCDGISW